MHELALIGSLVEAVEAQVPERVRRVRLEVGELAGVDAAALSFGFEVCVAGTRLDGAALEITSVAGRARCNACGDEHPHALPYTACACGSFDAEVLAGHELRVREVEVD